MAALDLDKRFNKILHRVVSVTLVSGGVLQNVQAIVKLLLFWLRISTEASNEDFAITEEAPTRSFSSLFKVPKIITNGWL